ncbi:MAG: hypothetical protein H6658_17650 [Ardenticatenaceae bacterium]|nr:hypothetical protein [Ardenticatenaceae bacterium]
MTGIPADTLKNLRQTLLQCEEYFDSNASLRDLFATDTLAPFRRGLPERSSLSARVDALIAYLSNKKLADGRSALPLFLHTLSQNYDPTDHRHTTLQTLAASLTPSPSPHVPPPPLWNTAAIRTLLTEALDDQSLTALAYDHFRAAYNEFSDGLTRSRKIQLLLDYCQRHNQLENLLTQIERLNPAQYRQHQPYKSTAAAVQTPSSPPTTSTDPFTHYENGLQQLETAVQHNPQAQQELSPYATRLRENINLSRRYGDTTDRRADRAEIIDNIDRFARAATQKSFNDWCHTP